MTQPFEARRWAGAMANGWGRRCPRCGQGPLFERWNQVRERCPACDLKYLLNQGDPWVFLLFLDRGVFILPPIAIIYFGLLPKSVPGIVAVFGAVVALLIYTTPHRYGVCVALDWLTRTDDPEHPGYPSGAAAARPPGPDPPASETSGNAPANDQDLEHDRG